MLVCFLQVEWLVFMTMLLWTGEWFSLIDRCAIMCDAGPHAVSDASLGHPDALVLPSSQSRPAVDVLEVPDSASESDDAGELSLLAFWQLHRMMSSSSVLGST